MRCSRKLLRDRTVWLSVFAFSFSPCLFAQAAAPNPGGQILHHVNQVLHWYRQWDGADIYAVRTGDELYVENGQAIAEQVVKLEFQSALTQAALLGQSADKPAAAGNTAQTAVDTQNIFKMQHNIGQQIQNLKAELDAVNQKISSVPSKQRAALVSQRDTLQGQLQLAQALQENLQKITSFMTTAENANAGANELTGKILALQRTVPGLQIAGLPNAANPAGKSQAAPASVAQVQLVDNSKNEGLVGQIGQMFHMMGSLRALDQLKDDTVALETSTQQLRAPLLAELRATLQEGQIEIQSEEQNSGASVPANSASTPAANPPQPQQPVPTNGTTSTTGPQAANPPGSQRSMPDLIQHFKQLSSATLPLSQELILIDQSQSNLEQLRASLDREYTGVLRSVLLRVAAILFSLGLIWLFSELWRRATFRYIRDARRRRQFLVLRRVVTGFCMCVVILVGFVSEFSSLATYAGLITAGIAVALQAIILSIAAYFFLVGRYGVRVGDRVTVVYNGANSVSGEVLDIGLVRFYLMELTGSGIEMQPTGRIVVFTNSVLFQATPLFKQIPGTEYTWRQLTFPLQPECDIEAAQQALLATVDDVYKEYRPLLEKQYLAVEQTLGLHMEVPKPYTHVRFFNAGLQIVMRYPIPLRSAADLDDRMIRKIAEMLRKNPALKLAEGSTPELRSAV